MRRVRKSPKPCVIGLILILASIVFLLWGNLKYSIIAFHLDNNNDGYQFRIMTWNICRSEIDNQEKQVKIAELIIAQAADFVHLNEFTLDSCLVIDSLLSVHYPYKVDKDAKLDVGDIYYSKIDIKESGKFNKAIFNVIYSKMCLGGDSLYVLGCHLPGNNKEGLISINGADSLRMVKTFWERYKQAQEKRKEVAHFLKESITDSSLPIIVLGDMNDFNCSSPMDSLNDAGMKNAWWEGGFGYGTTYHKGWLRLRIDHIYYNEKLMLKNVKVVDTNLSDHNILIADFSINN